MTNGRPVSIHLLKDSLSSEHSAAKAPVRTWRPALVRSLMPRPECCGFGSTAPTTNLERPDSRIAFVQAPVLPEVEQGSKVTYKVAPLGGRLPNCRRHSTSAWAAPALR